MTTDEKLKLITKNLEEVLTEEELKRLIESGTPLKHYIGFEISGKVHLGTGFASMLKIKDLQEAGIQTTVLLADWHTWLNKKLDGTLKTARKMAREYFEEGLKAAALCVGADPDKIEFVLGSELYDKLGNDYWATVVKVSKATTIARMLRSTTIMGRKESDISDSAMLIYPAMQSADIFAMNINIAHAGTDQRNVHVVARDAAKEVGFPKPIAIHHHLLLGLVNPMKAGDTLVRPETPENKEELKMMLKMSKSKPDSAVFIHDSPEEIERKVMGAFSPPGNLEETIEYNPILDWVKHLVFAIETRFIVETRDDGDKSFLNADQLIEEYKKGTIHPQDLKKSLAKWLIKKLEPARRYFEDPQRKAALDEIERLTTK